MWKYTGKERPSFANEPKDGQESVWDYPRPPLLRPEKRKVRIVFEGVTIAESERVLKICETASPPTYYIPMTDINMEYLKAVGGRSFCEWKGAASYYEVEVKGKNAGRVAWTYTRPSGVFAPVQDHISFYATPLQCYLGEERVRPQDKSGFYGGWVTDEIVGPWKGGDDPRAQGL